MLRKDENFVFVKEGHRFESCWRNSTFFLSTFLCHQLIKGWWFLLKTNSTIRFMEFYFIDNYFCGIRIANLCPAEETRMGCSGVPTTNYHTNLYDNIHSSEKLFSNTNRKRNFQNWVPYNFRLKLIFFLALSPSLFFFFFVLGAVMKPEDKGQRWQGWSSLDNRVSLQM